MAKGEMRPSKEAKKPKSDRPKASVSAYKQSLGKSAPAPMAPAKKK